MGFEDFEISLGGLLNPTIFPVFKDHETIWEVFNFPGHSNIPYDFRGFIQREARTMRDIKSIANITMQIALRCANFHIEPVRSE